MALTDTEIRRTKKREKPYILKGLERMGYKGKMTGHGFEG